MALTAHNADIVICGKLSNCLSVCIASKGTCARQCLSLIENSIVLVMLHVLLSLSS